MAKRPKKPQASIRVSVGPIKITMDGESVELPGAQSHRELRGGEWRDVPAKPAAAGLRGRKGRKD